MDYHINTKDQIKNKQKVRKKTSIWLLLAYLLGISLSAYTLVKYNTTVSIIIISISTTTIIFFTIVFLMIYRKKITEDKTVISINENSIKFITDKEQNEIDFSEIKNIKILKNKHGKILNVTLYANKVYIIPSFTEKLEELLETILTNVNISIVKEKSNNISINILVSIVTVIVFVTIYLLKNVLSGSVTSIILDQIIPFSGGVILLLLIKLEKIPNIKKFHYVISVGLILLSVLQIALKLSSIENYEIQITENYKITFPVEPAIKNSDIDDVKLTSYSCSTPNASYLIEVYDFSMMSISDNETYFESLAKDYTQKINGKMVKLEINDNQMSLEIEKSNNEGYFHIFRIISSENQIINSIIYAKNQKQLFSLQNKKIIDSLSKSKDS